MSFIFPANLPSYLRCNPGNWRDRSASFWWDRFICRVIEVLADVHVQILLCINRLQFLVMHKIQSFEVGATAGGSTYFVFRSIILDFVKLNLFALMLLCVTQWTMYFALTASGNNAWYISDALKTVNRKQLTSKTKYVAPPEQKHLFILLKLMIHLFVTGI